MKKNFFLLLFYLLLYTNNSGAQVKILSENLVTLEGKVLTKDTLKKGIWIILITDFDCGYCIKDIPYNNSFLENYKGKINAIALFKQDSLLMRQLENGYKRSLNWTKIPNSLAIQKKYWKYGGVTPQVHIYNNGKLYKIITDASDESKHKIEAIVDKLYLQQKS